MKDRQRWQPEEDAILKSYVKQYGPKEWNLISQRMPNPLLRDPKSCLERWKNYLKPGIKKGSLTPEEQSLVISLQSKYGNKWKKIAAEVPGRTAKRLGKWWEVFKEKQLKQIQKSNYQQNRNHNNDLSASSSSAASAVAIEGQVFSTETVAQGRYDHILDTFAEKYVQPKLYTPYGGNCQTSLTFSPNPYPNLNRDPNPALTLGSGWIVQPGAATSSSSTISTTPSPSVSLTLSPSDRHSDPELTALISGRTQSMGNLLQYCMEIEEGRDNWLQHRKESTWRLSRLEQQLEAEKGRRRREMTEEIERKIRCLREEEMVVLGRIESEYREQIAGLQRDAESKEGKLIENLCIKNKRFVKIAEQIKIHGGFSYNQVRI